MDDRLQSIITASKNVVINAVTNTYDYLDNILVFKEYEINPDDDLITQTKMFILRYRRIIGILLLIILLYMGFNCDFGQSRGKGENADRNENRKENIQKGGSNFDAKGMGFWNYSGGKEAKADSELANSIKAEHELEKKKAEMKAKLVKADANKSAKDAEDASKKSADAALQKKAVNKAARKNLSFLERKKLDYSGDAKLRSKASSAFDKTELGKKLSGLKEAGYNKKQIAAKLAYQAGAFVGDKAKEFAGWLYEILFAIAISIAICMVVLPSISFFIVGIICFFLLKSKISTFKSL